MIIKGRLGQRASKELNDYERAFRAEGVKGVK